MSQVLLALPVGCSATEAFSPFARPSLESGSALTIPGGAHLVTRSVTRRPQAEVHSAVSIELESPRTAHMHELVVTRGSLKISGEKFLIEHDAGTVFLRHSRWSLVGSGQDLLEAEKDLRSEIAELRLALASACPANFSSGLIELRNYATRVG